MRLLTLLSAFVLLQTASSQANDPVSSSYRDPLRRFSKSIQDSVSVYSFDVKRVSPQIGTLLNTTIDSSCTTERGTADQTCRLIQGLISVIGLCVIIAVLTIVGYIFYWFVRCYARCCCKKGNEASFEESKIKLIIFGAMLIIFTVFIIIFGAFVLDVGNTISNDVDGTRDSILSFVDTIRALLTSIQDFVTTSTDSIVSVVDASAGTLNGASANIQRDKIVLVSELSSLSTNFAQNFPDQALCTGCNARSQSLGDASTGMSSFSVPNTTFNFQGTSIRNKVNGSSSFVGSLSSLDSSLSKSKADITQRRDDAKTTETSIKAVVIAFAAFTMFLSLLVSLNIFLVKHYACTYCVFLLTWLPVAICWILFGILYDASFVLNSVCDLIPARDYTPAPSLFIYMSGDVASYGSDFSTECVVAATGGSMFKAFRVNSSSFLSVLDDFKIDKQINSTEINTINTQPLTDAETALSAVAATTPESLYATYAALTTPQKNSIVAYLDDVKSRALISKNRISYVRQNITILQTNLPLVSSTLATSLAGVKTNFLALDSNCGNIGLGFSYVRRSVCDGIGRTIDTLWFSLLLLAICLHWIIWPLFYFSDRHQRSVYKNEKKSDAPPSEELLVSAPTLPLSSSPYPSLYPTLPATQPEKVDDVAMNIEMIKIQTLMLTPAAPAAPAAYLEKIEPYEPKKIFSDFETVPSTPPTRPPPPRESPLSFSDMAVLPGPQYVTSRMMYQHSQGPPPQNFPPQNFTRPPFLPSRPGAGPLNRPPPYVPHAQRFTPQMAPQFGGVPVYQNNFQPQPPRPQSFNPNGQHGMSPPHRVFFG